MCYNLESLYAQGCKTFMRFLKYRSHLKDNPSCIRPFHVLPITFGIAARGIRWQQIGGGEAIKRLQLL